MSPQGQTVPPPECESNRRPFQLRLSALFVFVAAIAAHLAIARWSIGLAMISAASIAGVCALVSAKTRLLWSYLPAALLAVGTSALTSATIIGAVVSTSAFSPPDGTGWAFGGGWSTVTMSSVLGLVIGACLGLYIVSVYSLGVLIAALLERWNRVDEEPRWQKDRRLAARARGRPARSSSRRDGRK
jgi:MFS family permease